MDPQEFLRMRGIGVGKKLVGDAQSADVRAGKTFSNAQGNDKEGTMPVRSLVAQTITPGVNNIIKQAGIYDGDITIQGETDLVGANILTGKSIFGVVGTFVGKRFATGTVTIATGATSLTVTGLSFTPNFLYIRADSNYASNAIKGRNFSLAILNYEHYWKVNTGANTGDMGTITLNANGFTCPMSSVSQTLNYQYFVTE